MHQVYQAVKFEHCIRFVLAKGITRFVEVGSGKVLTGIIKKISPEAQCTPLDDIENLDQVF